MNIESSGEKQIKHVLSEKNIHFIHQYVLHGLKNDERRYRIADFYLPEYRVYIEYLGSWNNPDKIKRNFYRKKLGRKSKFT